MRRGDRALVTSRASVFQAGVRCAAQNRAEQMIVLGIDPGLANAGYGVVERKPTITSL
jgi:hypothetical protein